LEAVCVDSLEEVSTALDGLSSGRVALIENGGDPQTVPAETLAARVTGPTAVLQSLSQVFTAESFAEALSRRASLPAGYSIITRSGEWVGRNWLRVSRGVDHHAGVIEREHRLKTLRAD